MDIQIKKAKFTSSILSQTLVLTEKDILSNQFISLGWCIHKNIRWMIFQDKDNNLRKLPQHWKFFEEVNFDQIDQHGAREERFYLIIRFYGNFVDKKVWFLTLQERDNFKTLLEGLINDCSQKGQFFI